MPAPAGKHFYTEDEKQVFRTDPERFLEYRKAVDGVMQERFPIFLRNHPMHDVTTEMITQMISSRVGPDRQDLKKLFTPDFSPGCRRPTVCHLYYCFLSIVGADLTAWGRIPRSADGRK